MNQILATNNDGNNKKDKKGETKLNDYSENNTFNFDNMNSYSGSKVKTKSNGSDFKKIVIIFAVLLIVFGTALVGVAAIRNNKEKKEKANAIAKPEIIIEESGDKANIIATSQGALSKVSYYWDKNDIKEVNINGSTRYEISIDIPNGDNILYVEATDIKSQTNQSSKQFSRDGDVSEPQITTEDIGEGKILITVTDETSMDYIKYRWTDGEEETVKVENEGDNEITVTIDVPRGESALYITAYDTTGNEATKTQKISGILKPTIKVTKKGKKLKVSISHDKGLKKVKIIMNGESTLYNENSEDYDVTKTELNYTFELRQGKNEIAVAAISLEEGNGENSYNVFKGTTEYIPPEV